MRCQPPPCQGVFLALLLCCVPAVFELLPVWSFDWMYFLGSAGLVILAFALTTVIAAATVVIPTCLFANTLAQLWLACFCSADYFVRPKQARSVFSRVPGFCYLSTVPLPHRLTFLRRLGRYPRHHDFIALWMDLGLDDLPDFNGSPFLHPVSYPVVHPDSYRFTRRLGALADLMSTPLGSAALSPELRAYIENASQVFAAPVKIPSHLSELAQKFGILSNPLARPHPHPFHKALELKLHSVITGLFSGKVYSLLSRKPFPTSPLVDDAAESHNSILTGADLLRYPNGIFASPIISSPLAFLSDTLHMLNPADVAAVFDRSPDLDHLFATAIIAPEVLTDALPAFPDLYTLERRRGGWQYIPEGHVSGSYFQPDSAEIWLRCNLIHCDGYDLHISIVESYAAHHIFVISRAPVLSQAQRSFDAGSWTTVPSSYLPGLSASQRRARPALIEDMLAFADRYTGAKVEDFHAKAAQLSASSLSRYPYAEKRVAALLAHRVRSARSISPSFAGIVFFFFSSIFSFLFNPFAFVSSFWSSSALFDCPTTPNIVVDCHAVAAHSFPVTAWTSRSVFRAPQIFHPKYLTPLGTYALLNCLLFSWALAKVVLVHFLERLLGWHTFEDTWRVLHRLYFAAELTPARLSVSLLFLWLNHLGLFSIRVHILPPLRNAFNFWRVALFDYLGAPAGASFTYFHFVCVFFGVGGVQLTTVPGYHLFFQLFLSWYGFSTIFPSLFVSFYWRPGNVHHTIYQALTFTLSTSFSYTKSFACWIVALMLIVALVYFFFPALPTLSAPPNPFPFHSTDDDVDRPPRPLFHFFAAFLSLPFTLFFAFFTFLFNFILHRSRLFSLPSSEPLVLPLHSPFSRNMGSYGTMSPTTAPPVDQVLVPPAVLPAPFVVPRCVPAIGNPHAGYIEPNNAHNSGIRPGAANHPYASWLLRMDELTYQQKLQRMTDHVAPANTLDPAFSCFWTALSTLTGVAKERLMCTYFASCFTDDIFEFNYIGLVTPSQMTRICSYFGVGLEVMPHNGALLEHNENLVPHHFVNVAASEAHPVLHLILSQMDDPIRGRLIFHVELSQPRTTPAAPFTGHGRRDPIAPLPRPQDADLQHATSPDPVVGFTPTFLSFASFCFALRAVPAKFSTVLDPYRRLDRFSSEALKAAEELNIVLPPLSTHDHIPLPEVPLYPFTFSFSPSRVNADLLSQDLRNNPSVWLVRESDSDAPAALRALAAHAPHRKVKMTSLLGVPGCGKTYAARNLVSGSPNAYWVYPSAVVAGVNAADRPLGPHVESAHYVENYEVFRKNIGTTVVLDDFTRLPPGTLDLLVFLNPQLEHIIVTGDPSQTNECFPSPTAKTRTLPGIGKDLLQRYPTIPYCTVTRRLARGVAALFGLKTLSERDGHLWFISQPLSCLPFFCTSPRFAETKALGGTAAFVVAQSQGLDVNGDTVLDLGGMSSSMTDSPSFVGLTRGKGNIFLSFDTSTLPPAGVWGSSTILSTLVGLSADTRRSLLTAENDADHLVARAVAEHIRNSVPSLRPTAHAVPFIGAQPDSIPSLMSTPPTAESMKRALNFFTCATKLPRFCEPKASGVIDIPAPEVPSDPALFHERPEVKERLSREKVVDGSLSNQFPSHRHPGALHHRRGDRATEQMSYKKRLHTASVQSNIDQMNSPSSVSRAQQLKRGFKKVFRKFATRRDHSELFDLCSDEVLDTWCSKRTLKSIQASLANEIVDTDITFTRTFLKSQVVRKSEKWFSNAAPGQIVTQFPMQKTFRDAVYALALEKIVLAECPDNVYIHLRRSTADLADWTSRVFAGCTAFTETDYTSWDTSIDGAFINFDCWLLRQIGCPEDYIQSYYHEATSTRFFGGNLDLMQHSGNRYTFLLNTLRNLALTNASYNCLTGQAYGGDDSLLAGHPPLSPYFRPEAWKMVPKVQRTEVGHLFGHLITSGQLSYDYEYMMHRLETAIVERPYDAPFYRSFAQQMHDLPYVGHPHYAAVYDMFVSHVRAHDIRVPNVNFVSSAHLSFTPHSIFSSMTPFEPNPSGFFY